MKKFYSLLIVMTLAFSVSCFLQDDEDEAAPVGDGKISVTVNYSGGSPTFGDVITGDEVGTGKNYLYLYSTLGTKSNNPMPVYEGSSATNNSAITISNIAPGSYYIAVCYDYRGATGEPALTQANPYELYDGSTGTPLISEATKVQIDAGVTKTLSIDFSTTWVLTNRNFLTSK